jgi:hypothetical protein
MMAQAFAHHLPSLQTRRDCLRAAGAMLLSPVAGCGDLPLVRAPSADYASAMRQALQATAGDLRDYVFRPTPVGNFGVGSIYLDEFADEHSARVESAWFLGGPEQWLAPGRGSAERKRWMERLLIEGSLGSVRLQADNARELHVQAGIALLSELAGDVGVEARRGVQTRLETDELRQRRLNWAGLQAALRAGVVAPDVAAAVNRARFVVAAADLVLLGYRADIAVDEERSPSIALRLRTKALLPSRLGGQASLRVTEAAHGRFIVSSEQPVVAAVLFKRPPPTTKDLAGMKADLSEWPRAAVGEQEVARLESQVRSSGREP